jgi:hypothetical protein
MTTRLSFLTFPQRFDGTNLVLRVLVLPRLDGGWDGDPRQPLVPGAAAFADADLQLEARVLDGLGTFPVDAPVDAALAMAGASGVAGDARALFEALVAPQTGRFQLAAAPGPPAESAADGISLRKYLPRSYRSSFLFTGPRHPGARTDDAYHCAVKAAATPNPNFVATPDAVSWGQVYAYCLRHPQLARRVGLIREASVPVGSLFAKGGYVSVDLAAGSDYAAEQQADRLLLARYAARVPALTAGLARPVFGAVQFPVVVPPAVPQGTYDQAFIEAADYDDGFAKVVHGFQPVSQDLLAEEADGFPPLTDIGIRLGWDDEQILIWQARQLQADPTVPPVGGQPQRLDAPMGAFGYRVDARRHGEAAWHSLVAVRSRAPLTLDGIPLGDPPDQPFVGELAIEVHPQQFDGVQPARDLWLPAYLAQWNGTSTVLPDEIAAGLFHVEAARDVAVSLGRLYDAVDLEDIPLRYGHSYDLRVRLADPTGGGPAVADEPVNEGPSPVAEVHFVRHVVPEPLRITDLPAFPDGAADDLFTGDAIEVRRPLLGYPAVVFSGGYADPVPLLQAASEASVGKGAFGIPDPDVRRVQVDVEVRALAMDNQLSLSGTEPYARLYTTTRALPAELADPLSIPLTFLDAPVLRFGDPTDLGDLGLSVADVDARDDLPLPTGRMVRLTLRALCDDDAAYFAPGAHVGRRRQLRLRRASRDERGLFAAASPARTIRGIWLRPDPPPLASPTPEAMLLRRVTDASQPSAVARLATELDLDARGMTLSGRRGERGVFANGRAIRATVAPDGSSLTLGAKDDLVNHWIVALTLQLDRDWTWDGLQHLAVDVFRTRRFARGGPLDDNGGAPVATFELLPTASLLALDGPDRDHTRLVLLDAVEPKPDGPADPDVVQLTYRVEARFADPPDQSDPAPTFSLDLPVTTTPAQVPRIVAAGLALSPYERDATYASTAPRRRALWLELDEAPRDPHDEVFVRFLAYAPDPLLSDNRADTLLPPEESPLAIDPEPVRVITPGQADDQAGLGAMTPLVASDGSRRHYLVPLPPGLNADSPELFGMFTYELRIGHAHVWSTAQGRFGRPLRATGVQHPAPTLFCTVQRTIDELVVEAPFARAVLRGRNVTADPPRTQLWALLYAQVRQADGADWRNVLLDDRRLRLVPRVRGRAELAVGLGLEGAFQNRDAPAHGATAWAQAEIERELRRLGLPTDSPISVLCVEVMPSLAALRRRPVQRGALAEDRAGLVAVVAAERAFGTTLEQEPDEREVRPLSEGLGHFRILRTSPLAAAPPVC